VERKWGVTDQVHSCQLQQKCESALGPDLALMLRWAHKLASMLERGAHRLALKLKHEASLACICVETRSYTCSHFNIEMRCWGLCLKEQYNHRALQRLRGSHLRLEHNLYVWQMTQGPRLGWDATLVFGMRPTSEAGTRHSLLRVSRLRLHLQ